MPNPGSGQMQDLTTLQREYSIIDRAIMQARNVAPLTAIMKAKAKTRKVTDVKVADFEDKEPVMSFTAYGNDSGAGTKTDMAETDQYIYIANASTRLKPYDLLKFNGYDPNNYNDSKQAHGETMMVLSTPSTHTVHVKRNIEAPATSAYNMKTQSGSYGLTCQKIGNALKEDSTSRVPKIPALMEKYNYIQIFEEPVSVSDLVSMSKYKGGDELKRRAKNAFIDLLRGVEGALLYNHRSLLDVDGEQTFVMGGVEWHMNYADSDNGTNAWASAYDLVTGDGTSRIWRPGADFNSENWEKYVVKAFEYGNDTKLGLCGKDFLRILKSEYRGQVIYERDVTDFGLTVLHYTEQGKEIQFVHDPEMDILGPRDLMLLDMEYVELGIMKDIHRRTEIQANDATGRKDDWMAYLTLLMHFQKAHSYVQGMDDIT